jgi:hypothetical protein
MVDRPIAFAAPRLVISGKRRDTFQYRRLSRAILTDKDGDRSLEFDFEAPA